MTRVREITAADARIEWAVHLVNRKAAAERIPEGTRAAHGRAAQ